MGCVEAGRPFCVASSFTESRKQSGRVDAKPFISVPGLAWTPNNLAAHAGMVSPFKIAADAEKCGKFLDEFLVWRELSYTFCCYKKPEDLETLDALPKCGCPSMFLPRLPPLTQPMLHLNEQTTPRSCLLRCASPGNHRQNYCCRT